MPIDAVLFDNDGTLVDSEPLTSELIVEVAREHGVILDIAETSALYSGGKMTDVVRDIERASGAMLPDDFVERFRSRQADAFRDRLRPMDGARELLEATRIPCAVVSNAPRAKIELTLGLTGLLDFFEDRIFSAYEVDSWKPDPGLFLHAAERQAIDPARCAVVEDSLAGIYAGLAAGMQVFAFRPEGHPPLGAPLPDGAVEIGHLSELAEHFGR